MWLCCDDWVKSPGLSLLMTILVGCKPWFYFRLFPFLAPGVQWVHPSWQVPESLLPQWLHPTLPKRPLPRCSIIQTEQVHQEAQGPREQPRTSHGSSGIQRTFRPSAQWTTQSEPSLQAQVSFNRLWMTMAHLLLETLKTWETIFFSIEQNC